MYILNFYNASYNRSKAVKSFINKEDINTSQNFLRIRICEVEL